MQITLQLSISSHECIYTMDHVLQQLRDNDPTLETLNLCLWDNRLGEVGGAAVAAALERNTTLTALDFSYNDLREVGAMAVFGALERNTTLTELKLSDFSMSTATKHRIKNLLQAREAPEVYDIPRVKAAVAPIPRGTKRTRGELQLLLL